MVSYYYAKKMSPEQHPKLPLFIDSGGFVSLFEGVTIRAKGKLGIIEIKKGDEVEIIHSKDVLELRSQIADVAFTLDFPIPPNMDSTQAKERQNLTIANAHWALDNKRRRDLPIYACVQTWNAQSDKDCAKAYANCGFDGIAIGELVPRVSDLNFVLSIVETVRNEIGDLPLHIFGLGSPTIIQKLYAVGVDSVDSSSYIKYAASGKLWSNPDFEIQKPTVTDRLHLALCNLAAATGKTLPLSASEIIFSTISLGKTKNQNEIIE
ncbi:tRNA-guanine transglycosylase [Nodularia sp. LEGE 04288]|nr:tRNA-guanine transglycosylase [Nodularia sp. LEGE 04288]